MIHRRYVMFTDDEDLASGEVLARRSVSTMDGRGYRGWDMAKVSEMVNPPVTDKKFCVFQILENK